MNQPAAEVLQVIDPGERRTLEWLQQFCAPGQVTELRALNVKRRYGRAVTISGYYEYDRLDVMVRDAFTLSKTGGKDSHPAPGVYFVINPVKPELLARRSNRCDIAESGSLTTDLDIVSRRWLYIDVDPVRASNISASDSEKIQAENVAFAVHSHLVKQGWPLPFVVDSGNGWHLYYRIDLPVDDGSLIKRFLQSLASQFDTPTAKIDTSVFNPSRISKLPGTKSRKGDDVADRPHRFSVIASAPAITCVTREQIQAVADLYQPAQQPEKPKGRLVLNARTVSMNGSNIVQRARAYLESMPTAVSGQGGHQATYNAACRLVRGFALSVDDAFPLLANWNQSKCLPPWSDGELRHKLESASLADEPLGSLLDNPERQRSPRERSDGDTEDVLCVDDPRRLALLFLERFCTPDGEYRFLHWNESWYKWDSVCYQSLELDGLKSLVTNFIQQEFEADAMDRLERFKMLPLEKQDKPPKAIKVSPNLRNSVIEHLSALTYKPPTVSLHSWMRNKPEGFDSKELIVARNGIVNLRRLISGYPNYLIPSNPDYFATGCLPFDFNEASGDPVEWLKFLDTIWPNDPDSIRCLQEWIGLMLVPDSQFQKMMMIVGPPRCGKGTIARIIRDLVGDGNFAALNFSDLSTTFGCWPLIGKQVAVIPDARLSPKTDTSNLIERLLSISGEDLVTINRKGLKQVTMSLPSRITIMTNEIPRFVDTSGALASRFIILELSQSFLGREDLHLHDRLRNELPAILTWAICGWQRLVEQGRFTVPQSSENITQQLTDSSSPIGAFIREKCDVGIEYEVDRKLLFQEWQDWCESEHRAGAGNSTSFGISLRSIIPHLGDRRKQMLGARTRYYTGLRLKTYETGDNVGQSTNDEVGHLAATLATNGELFP